MVYLRKSNIDFGEAIPWFDRVGGATRVKSNISFNNLQEGVDYEIISVADVPPTHFAEQFMKDLSNEDITNISQIRWRFNREKNPANFRENMMKAIDKFFAPSHRIWYLLGK